MICLRAAKVADTEGIAAAFVPVLRAGDCVVLAGEMGAGKTTFTRALANAAGVATPVTSPTFTLVRSYSGAHLTIHHADVYRLERMDEVADLAFDELLDDGVLVVEWGDAVRAALPSDRVEIGFAFDPNDEDVRTIEVDPIGGTWDRRTRVLAGAIGRWSVPC